MVKRIKRERFEAWVAATRAQAEGRDDDLPFIIALMLRTQRSRRYAYLLARRWERTIRPGRRDSPGSYRCDHAYIHRAYRRKRRGHW